MMVPLQGCQDFIVDHHHGDKFQRICISISRSEEMPEHREDDDRKDHVARCCSKGSCSDRCEESVAEICFVQLGKTSRPRGEKPRLSNMSVFVRGFACASLFGSLVPLLCLGSCSEAPVAAAAAAAAASATTATAASPTTAPFFAQAPEAETPLPAARPEAPPKAAAEALEAETPLPEAPLKAAAAATAAAATTTNSSTDSSNSNHSDHSNNMKPRANSPQTTIHPPPPQPDIIPSTHPQPP